MIWQTGEFAYGSGTNWTQAIYNFVSQFDNRITLDNGKMRFDNKFDIEISAGNTVTLTYDSDSSTRTVLSINPYWASSGTCVLTLIVTNNFFYLNGYRKGYPNQAQFVIVWIKSDNSRDYIGGTGGQSESYKNADGCVVYDAITPGLAAYNFGHVANYTLQSPKLAYSDKLPLVQSSGDVDLVSNVISGSVVPLGSTVTISGHNYFSIGTKVFIPVDSSS